MLWSAVDIQGVRVEMGGGRGIFLGFLLVSGEGLYGGCKSMYVSRAERRRALSSAL